MDHEFEGTAEETLCEAYPNFNCQTSIGSGTAYPSASMLSSSTISGDVCVVGDFLVDVPFTFDGAVVKIDPGVEIEIAGSPNGYSPGSYLIVDNTKMFACEGLWGGIVLGDVSGIYTRNNSEIEDAEKAILASTGFAALNISSTTFNRNRIGIELEVPTPNSLSPGPIVYNFEDNDFTCTAPLNGSTDEITEAGVKLIDASLFAFLPNVTQPNDFNDIQYGILAEGNCQIGMSYVRMDSIQEAGIDLESGWLRLRHSYMRSCQQDGIRVGNAVLVDINDLQVEMPDTESSIPRVGIGINEFSLNAKVEIFDYDFDGGVIPGTVSDGVVGIHLNREDNMGEGSTLSIKQSTFKFQAANSEGIILDGTFPPSSSTEIWLNYFEVSSIFGGNLNRSVAILTQGNKNNLSIKWNSFTSYDTEPKEHWNIGIWARTNFTGLNNKISINDFNGDIEMMQDNLFVQFFQNATIFNNTFRGGNFGVSQSTGALFEALCMGTDFKCNRFTFSGTNALRLASGAIVGEQIHKGNKWFNFSGAEPGNHVLCQADPENNIFEVHTLQSTCTYESLPCFSEFYPRRVTVTSGGNLFQTDLSGTPPSDCDTRSANHIVYIDTVDIKIAQGDYGAPGFDSAEVWMMERYLYQKLKNDTSLLSEHPSLPTFLSNNSSTTVGAFYELDQDIRAALKMNEPLNINTSQLLSEIDSLQLEVAEVDSIIAVSGWSTSLLQDKRDFIEDIQLRYKDYDSLRVAYNTGLATALQSAANDNQSIVTSHDYELNEKIVKGIYLQSLMNQGGQLTEDQIDSLLVIAGQSIDQGGPAGQYAFDLLPGCVKDSIGQQFLALRSSEQEPSAEVGENDSLTSDSEVGTKEREVYVYPNPSNGSRLTIKRHVSAPVQLLLIDLSGKTWMNQPKEGNMIQLAVPSSTPSGTYVLRLVGDKGYIVNKRLVILR